MSNGFMKPGLHLHQVSIQYVLCQCLAQHGGLHKHIRHSGSPQIGWGHVQSPLDVGCGRPSFLFAYSLSRSPPVSSSTKNSGPERQAAQGISLWVCGTLHARFRSFSIIYTGSELVLP